MALIDAATRHEVPADVSSPAMTAEPNARWTHQRQRVAAAGVVEESQKMSIRRTSSWPPTPTDKRIILDALRGTPSWAPAPTVAASCV
jgi:hypothetical protein